MGTVVKVTVNCHPGLYHALTLLLFIVCTHCAAGRVNITATTITILKKVQVTLKMQQRHC